jgi:hypothetical protein
MNDLDLARHLRKLRRSTLMLETELRHGRLDADLVLDIDHQMENGIASEPRCARIRDGVDALRESTLTPRPELISDTVRACDKLIDVIDGVLSELS